MSPFIKTKYGPDHQTSSLGIDVGGSATRWCLYSNGKTFEGSTSGFSGHLSNENVLRHAKDALASISVEIGPVDTIVAGVTGLSRKTSEAEALASLLESHFKATQIELMSDIELATRAAFEPETGILVYAGTGSIAACLGRDGVLQTAGGKGVLIDDAGGGYWIAIAAMRLILRAEDMQVQKGWSTGLGQALARHLGGTDWPYVRSRFYALDRGGVAMLAMAVGEAAQNDDADAVTILTSAGHELAFLARTLSDRTGIKEIGLAGRASKLHPIILESMKSTAPDLSIHAKSLDAAKTAMNLAQDLHDHGKLPM